MKPTLFISFVRHYWPILLIFVVLVILGRIDAVTYFVGPIFYLIQMVMGCMCAAAFAKHAFFRYTIDSYTECEDGSDETDFISDWKALDPNVKVICTLSVFSILYIGACLIASSIAK